MIWSINMNYEDLCPSKIPVLLFHMVYNYISRQKSGVLLHYIYILAWLIDWFKIKWLPVKRLLSRLFLYSLIYGTIRSIDHGVEFVSF